ncbi:hypothetical protein PAXRUDRAFT_9870 [Paxillus rubicundulus Ve08.2h10]|uniref:Zn(2)-C6 fungal-type domain-containing protein n=1 Tax=Paxillus rubicundulus Ve08.2h10 TaxID=930991 RepID=A0A0D0E224_9AGAM|nr:hypothetical protein PAXRUDRAFT_9870 [Paxillus rubicundulus Ve08.2h10]
MPQAPRAGGRQDNKQTLKAIDKEQKRNRGVMSCAECRRLKLKCDKTVPCSSCKRRGCSAICPNGSLITGQGTRFVLADTEKLHEKISLMSDRIRQLEDALAALQSSVSSTESHPLLHRELLGIKSIIDLHAAVEGGEATKSNDDVDDDSQYIESFGTLALRDDGAATFYGPSAGSESLLIGESAEPVTLLASSSKDPALYDLPRPVKHLSNSFPLAPVFNDTVDLNYLVQNHLPSWHRARQLSELYLSQAPWFFGAVTKRQLLEECLPLWYTEASDLILPGSVAPPTEANAPEAPTKTAHELALLFVIFCFGALTDDTLPAAPDNEEADIYFKLARAALNLEPVLDRPPSVSTVQTLALLAIYQGLCSGENSIESTWGIFGLATKLAQSIGLHRDCARWQLSSPEVQKRRALFWELFITDGWQSLATGRLATFYMPYVDCELPNDPDPTVDDDGSILPSFPAWKARFGYECVSAIIQNAQTAKVPKYSVIIELDRKVRDMKLPKYTQRVAPRGVGLAETMKHYMPINYQHFTLLYIHRCFFAEAVSNSPTNPMNSPYAPSFLAGYRSACTLLGSLRTQFDIFPAQIARFWVLWTHAFSSSVMLASIVTHATGSGTRSKITSAAITELRRAVDLFKEASTYGGRAGKFLPILQRLLQKAERAHSTATPAVIRKKDIFLPSTEPGPKDELSIFSGRINKVTTRVPTSAASPGSGSGTRGSSGSTGDIGGHPSPQVIMDSPPVPGFTSLHPTLRDHWANFDGDLNTQLSNAQRDDYYTDADTHMVPAEEQRGMTVGMDERLEQVPSIQPLYRVVAPPPEFQSGASYQECSPTTSYGSNHEDVGYSPTAERKPVVQQQLLGEQPYQREPQQTSSYQPTLQFHHYQPDLHRYQQPQPTRSQLQFQSRSYQTIDTPYAEYAQAPFQHQSQDERQQQRQQHYYHADHVPHYATSTSSQHSLSATDYQYPSTGYPPLSVQHPSQNWDDLRPTYQSLTTSAQPLVGQFAEHDYYTHPASHESATKYPSQEQHHLQETWQSFHVYVGSPRPTS